VILNLLFGYLSVGPGVAPTVEREKFFSAYYGKCQDENIGNRLWAFSCLESAGRSPQRYFRFVRAR